MRNMNRITLLVICFMLLVLSGTAGAQNYQIPCVCFDENGVIINDYLIDDPASVYCYTCSGENVCEKTDLTLLMCRSFNITATSQALAALQPVATEEPPVPASAAEAPVTVEVSAPVVEEPAPAAEAPVIVEIPAPVVEEPAPAAEAPVTVEVSAPVVEEPAPAAEAPVTVEVPAPVVEEPAPAAEAPVIVEVPAPVVEEPAPVAEAPVSVEIPAPVVEEPAPVAEAPVSVEIPAPVVEEPASVAEAPESLVEVPVRAASTDYEEPAQDNGVSDQTQPSNADDGSVDETAAVKEQPVIVPVIMSAGKAVSDEKTGEDTDRGLAENTAEDTKGEQDVKSVEDVNPDKAEGSAQDTKIDQTAGAVDDEQPGSDEKSGEGGEEKPSENPVEENGNGTEEGSDEEVKGEPGGELSEGNGELKETPAEDNSVPEEKTAGEEKSEPTEDPAEDEKKEQSAGAETPASYIVQEGDTCESIANDLFGVDYDLFMQMNNMSECSIEVNQQVLIPAQEEEADHLANAEKEGPIIPMLLSSGISIEGKLKDLALSSPSGETFTTTAVPFTWVYTVSDDSKPVEVQFNLTLVINNLENGQKTTSTTVVSSAICKNFICTYTAGSELSGFKKADVTWTVSGEYDDGGTAVTVSAANPAQKTFKLDVKDPAPKPEPTPKPPAKPEAPVQECPVGRYTVRSLGFYWAPSANAETYTVVWHNDREQSGKLELSNNDPTCKQGRCIAYTTLPGIGKYVWTVTAKNQAGSAESKQMTFEIATNVSTPTPYLPNGTVFNSTYPAFQWEDVEDGVFEYRIQIVGKYDGRIRYDRWFDVKEIYVGNGVCYVKTDLFLPAGTYSWRVLGRNSDFSSRWSSWLDFYVQCDYCNYNNTYFGNYANTIPSTSYPTAVITTMTPEFQWRTLTGASFYQVKVTDAAGKEVFTEQVPSSYCTVEMCTWDPGKKLPGNGKYSWTVSGYGPSGGFWGSSTGSFTVQAQIVIDPMNFISPEQNGYLNPQAPLIIWTDPGDTAVLFDVQIFDGNNNSLLNAQLDRDQAWCDGLTCSIAFQTIPDGVNYRIAITPYSEYNTKGEMIELVFSKGGRSIRLVSPKEGSFVQSRPLFRWVLEDGIDVAYDLILTDADNNVTIYSPLVCGSGGVTCEDGEAFYSPAEALALGTYTAVLDIPTAGVTGEAVTFTVQ